MLSRIFPVRLDNTFRGSKVALWLFFPLVLLKLVMSVNSIVITRAVTQGADGIPLDAYGGGGAQAVLSLFAAWGLAQLMLMLLCVLALVRYRAMIPLLYLVLLVEALGRKWIFLVRPIVRSGTSTSFNVNLVLMVLLAVGLLLSLLGGDGSAKSKS